MTESLAIVDYGLGNLFSIQRGCEHAGMKATITSDRAVLETADAIILPGVGAFGDAMQALHQRDLVAPLTDLTLSGKPLIGICLGLQLLMSESHEFGTHQGLDLIKGTVERLPTLENPLKIPQVGWKGIHPPNGRNWSDTILDGVKDGTQFYFVHSFYVKPHDDTVCLSKTRFGDFEFCSSIQKDNIAAVQYHPERSGRDGLALFANIARLLKDGKLR